MAKRPDPVQQNAGEQLRELMAENEWLFSINQSIASVKSKNAVLEVLMPELKAAFQTEDIFLCMLENNGATLVPFLRVADNARKGNDSYIGVLNGYFPVKDGFIDAIIEARTPVVFNLEEVAKRRNAPGYISGCIAAGLVESLSVVLLCGEIPIGVCTCWSGKKGGFSKSHERLLRGIAFQLAFVLMNISEREESRQRVMEKEILLKVTRELNAIRNKKDLLPLLRSMLEQLSFYNDISIARVDENGKTFSAFALNEAADRVQDPDYEEMAVAHHAFPDGVFEWALHSEIPVMFDLHELAAAPRPLSYITFLHQNGISDMVGVSLRDGNTPIGAMFLFSKRKFSFTAQQLGLVQGIASQLGTVMANMLANEKLAGQLREISRYKMRLEEENQYLLEEVRSGYSFNDMVGKSAVMREVFDQVSKVAPTNSTVLVLGETGTGKELVARAIHNASPRKNKLLVKVNCAALPANLVESELFGHEKGSFTGAFEKKIGKFELANNGTLFLDEIGEMPIELQVKLLRAIQEKEIERIGGKAPIRLNVRIIAATNRNLAKEAEAGNFRQDLFYRLNVFPIVLPPLRERKEDIPLLVPGFLEKYSRNAGKEVKGVSASVMNALMRYIWPGNVRELEHLVERAVLLANGPVIRELDLPSATGKTTMEPTEKRLKTLAENERDYIITVLNKCKGKVYGEGGAAAILNLPVSTLNARIKKLGIKKNRLFN
ncbi:MAG: sigma 54-interacting transcriptional regulator [Chitinophagaceae bacterium]